ncbi:DNA polymerase IV [Leptolyngbya sp. FACHB-321]|uniref:DNA polymerase IV n=1 Tax=Leptolyngbya sp. FACHB-321 TaxID=2692807 RepID=UPI001F54D1F1|nr:DNA polymerase IV [Leptolyngbya sp. FACHB-321]
MDDTKAVPRKIIHIDMDAFFAAVEQRDHPQYRGQPLVVGSNPAQRGVVAAASYEARQYGIYSALPSRLAQQRCPHLIFVKPRFEVYRSVSQQIRDIFDRYTNLVEPLALDEAYLDVTTNKPEIASAMAIARAIKQVIRAGTQLTASTGVSYNKFLAKLASGLDKPDGLYLIAPEQGQAVVEALPIAKFYGVGAATTQKMQALGIHTGFDLKQWSEADLRQHFGKTGSYYYRVARAEDERPVNPNRSRKSIGAEQSFAEDLEVLEDMDGALATLAGEVATRMDKHQRYGYTLTLKVKYADYQQMTRAQTVECLLRDTETLYSMAKDLLRAHLDPIRKVRLLGLTVSNLGEPTALPRYTQLSLSLPPFCQ